MKKSSINISGNQIEFILEYKKRKTLSIEVHPNGEVKVKSPFGIKENQIREFLIKKSQWIIEKTNKANESNKNIINKKYVNGEKLLLLGEEYLLKVVNHTQFKKNRIEIIGDEIIVLCKSNDKETIKEILEKWYKKRALENIEHRINYFQTYFINKPKSIRIKAVKTRWGSCTYYNDLMFNYKLIMAPQYIIDYVVVHEMCHMNHKNHSKGFWDNVQSILPDYKERKEWLKDNGYKLDIETTCI